MVPNDPPVDPPIDPPNDPPADPPNDPPNDPPADPPANMFAGLEGDWRNDFLTNAGFEGDDLASRMKQLDRVSDLSVLAKNYFNAQDKIRQGLVSTGLPENPTEEQLAEFRQANDIPESFDKYQIELENGMEMSDAQAEVISNMLEIAHQANVPNGAVNGMVNTMMATAAAREQARVDQDGVDVQASESMLREAWGSDYETNVNVVQNMLNTLPAETKELFESARLSDGKLMLNDPAIFMWLGGKARELNPAGVVVPNSANPAQAITDEIAALEKEMKEDFEGWHKKTDKNARLEELYAAQDALRQQQS